MKFVRKAVVLLLAAAMLFSFCACASGAEKTVLFSYEGTDFYSGTFSYMLSSEKAYYEQQFAYINYYYSGANLGWSSVLDEETGMTYADAVWESLVLNAKRMVIVNHLLKQYNLKLSDESAVSTIEGYIEQDMEDYGDGNEYGLNLFYADYGVDIDMVRDYYLNNASLSVLRDYLYGDNGIQKIAADAVRESFDEQYYKVESIFFNYYTDTGSTTLKTPEGVTDEAIAEYFKENYVKVRHILFKTVDDSRNPLPDDQIAVKKAEAQELTTGSWPAKRPLTTTTPSRRTAARRPTRTGMCSPMTRWSRSLRRPPLRWRSASTDLSRPRTAGILCAKRSSRTTTSKAPRFPAAPKSRRPVRPR